jgi:hypothetical protein
VLPKNFPSFHLRQDHDGDNADGDAVDFGGCAGRAHGDDPGPYKRQTTNAEI